MNGNGQTFSIPGLTYTGGVPTEPPLILVVGDAKSGKSTTTVSLVDFPAQGAMPLVIAADPSGPDSCSKFGYRIPVLKIKDMPGIRYSDKTKAALDAVERGFQGGMRPGSIVVDCMSTLVERLLSDEQRHSKNPDPRAAYFPTELAVRACVNRLCDLGVPVVLISWLKEGGVFTSENAQGQKIKRLVLGGANVMGDKIRAFVAGKPDMIMLLEKVKAGVGAPGADPEGYVRQFRTKTYDNIECGGRYTLPDPAPAHLGWCLNVIMGRIPNPALPQTTTQQVQSEVRHG